MPQIGSLATPSPGGGSAAVAIVIVIYASLAANAQQRVRLQRRHELLQAVDARLRPDAVALAGADLDGEEPGLLGAEDGGVGGRVGDEGAGRGREAEGREGVVKAARVGLRQPELVGEDEDVEVA